MRQFFIYSFIALICVGGNAPVNANELSAPPLMLANIYHDQIVLADYWVSEKLDGMRAYWDGEKLISRGGERINAPAWFTAGWPTIPLDVELWIGRGQFSQTVSIVRQQIPNDEQWHTLHFMVFDLPSHPGTFDARNAALQQLIPPLNQAWIAAVKQFKVSNKSALLKQLHHVVRLGGEGLMLHRGASLYQATRNDDLLKLKLFDDAEAQVVGYLPGQGKYRGKLGALQVLSPAGIHFNLGGGFSDAQRQSPPPLGSWVTYRYNGLNEKSGKPRFARFMRVREDKSY